MPIAGFGKLQNELTMPIAGFGKRQKGFTKPDANLRDFNEAHLIQLNNNKPDILTASI